MARTRVGVLPTDAQIGMTLDRYQELMGLDICAFNGINRPTEDHDNQCIDIMTQSQRDTLATFLLQAEEMREEELGFFVSPKWFSEWSNMGINNPFTLSKKHLIEVSYPTSTLILAGYVLDHGPAAPNTANPPTDPVVITVATTVTDTDEIVVTYPGETVEITPSSVTIAGGVATIRIPRCRLVDPDFDGDWDDPYSYYDTAPFLTTVDIYRYWGDPAFGAEFLWGDSNCSADNCSTICQSACPMIYGTMAYDLSIVHLHPATYANGVWTQVCISQTTWPDAVRVTYKSGLTGKVGNELSTIRLAHTLMPYPPCQCAMVKDRWIDDRTFLEGSGYTPYGMMNGAMNVWMFDNRLKIGAGGMFPRADL